MSMTVKEVATELDTDPRTLRKFLRSDASPIASVGKGQRYAIERKSMRSIKARYATWHAARTAADQDPEQES